MQRGWYRTRPDRTRLIRYGIGVAAVVVTGGICVALAAFTSYGLVGVALVMPAAGLLAWARSMPVRTAAGSLALQQLLALRRYIEAAQAQQLRWEDSHGMFSQLMPYAMVFGQVEAWTAAFRPLAMAPATGPSSLGWYDSTHDGWDLARFGTAMSSFADSVRSAMSSTSDSGSGWSGSGVGSGGGGGGGGGW